MNQHKFPYLADSLQDPGTEDIVADVVVGVLLDLGEDFLHEVLVQPH